MSTERWLKINQKPFTGMALFVSLLSNKFGTYMLFFNCKIYITQQNLDAASEKTPKVGVLSPNFYRGT